MHVYLSLLGVFLVASLAEATMVLNLSALPGASEVVVAPGEKFGALVSVSSTDQKISGLDFRLGSNSIENFELLGVVNWEPWVARGVRPELFRAGWNLVYPGSFGPGTSIPGSVQLGVKASASPGVYTLSSTQAWGYLNQFSPAYVPGVAGSTLTVRVVPEPGTLWLVAISGIGLWCRRR